VIVAALLAHAGESHGSGFNLEWISYGAIVLGVIYAAFLVFSKR
jgi:hypothetical protein